MNGEGDKIPDEIEKRLRYLAEATAVFVPPSIDEAILRRGRERFAEIRRRRAKARRVWWASAAAAVVVLAFLALTLPTETRYERADIDRSGGVDILDALALERRIQEGSASGFDFNNDGAVDRLDVDAVAAQAVRLKKDSA